MKEIFEKIQAILDRLSSKPQIGGLQITDSMLFYARVEKNKPVFFSVRLPPGIVQDGRIQDVNQFKQALRELHQMAQPAKPKEQVQVFVSLPSQRVYTQTFTVPNIDTEKLKESAALNLQMLSPIPVKDAYLDWQVIDESRDQYELLGAFVEKKVVDTLQLLFVETNFRAVAFEFPGLALSRLIATTVNAGGQPFLLLHVSPEGLSLYIFRHGALYFDYFRSWQSVRGESREITKTAFESAVAEEVQKVVNFSLSRFQETVSQALIIAPGYEQEVARIISGQSGLKVAPFLVQGVAPTWYAVIGSALRGNRAYLEKKIMSLGTESSLELLYHDRLIHFIHLWRNIVLGTVLVLLIALVSSAVFLVEQSKEVTSRLEAFKARAASEEVTRLTEKAQEFNTLTAAIQKTREGDFAWSGIFNQLKVLADAERVRIEAFEVSGVDAPILLQGKAPDNATVIKFKNLLAAQENFLSVDLPLSRVAPAEDGFIGFVVHFKVKKE